MNQNYKNLIQKWAARLAGLAAIAFATSQAVAAGTNVVIVEAYGGGGNTGAPWKNDFIGLFNRGTTPVDLTGWTVQYNSANSTTAAWQSTPLSGTIPAGGYYLVQEAAGANLNATPLPTPDVTGTIPMGSGGFKVALVAGTTLLTGQNATGTGPTIVDFVGAAANGFEGSGPVPALSNTTSAQRLNNGCTDTDDNTNDFVVAAPNPRNSATPLHSCAIAIPPVISTVNPSSLTTNAGSDVTFTVSLAQGDAPLFYQWFTSASDNTLTPIANATNSSLLLPSVLAIDSTNYVVVVTNNATSANSVTSSPVTLSVIDPAINLQPNSQTNLPNSVAQFRAEAAGTGISYQWYFCADPSDAAQISSPVTDTTLPSGAIANGSQTSTLTLTNVSVAAQTNFALVVTGTFGSVTSSVVTLTISSTAVPLAFWNFNGPFDTNSPAPTEGIGTAVAVSVTPFMQPTRDPNDTGEPNTAWGTQNYPSTATVSNKQTGVQFNVNTLGAKNIKVSFDLRGTSTASKYQRLQYTTNGTDFIDYPLSQLIVGTTYNSYAYDLTGYPGVANNTNFGIRIVTEFESTANYNNTNDATYVGVSSTYGSGGTLSYDLVEITGDAITSPNLPPTISPIANASMEDGVGTNITFTVSDDTTPAGSLTISAASLLPTVFISATPANTAGTVHLALSSALGNIVPINIPMLVTVTDGNGNPTVQPFLLTVGPNNAAPVFGGLITTNMLTNSTLVIPFTVQDDHTPASSLTVSVASGTSSLIPADASHLVVSGSGTNRTLTITSVPGQTGAAPITLSTTDGDSLTGTKTFVVEVLPNTNVVLIDNFAYDTAGPLVIESGGLWQTHSGTADKLQVANGVATIDSIHNSEDVNALLFGAPYPTNVADNVTLYVSYTLNFTALPDATGAYITHFKDNTIFNFFARVWASTLNAATGDYRLSIANITNQIAGAVQLPQDLVLNSNYTIVVRYSMTSGFSTLWLNPTSESSASVTDTTDIGTNRLPVFSYAFRESNTSGGTVNVSNLKVGTSFTAVTGLPSGTTPPPPSPTIGSISLGGPGNTNIILTGTNNSATDGGSFVVLSSTNIALPLSQWTAVSTQTFSGGTFSFTNGIGADPHKFYIIQALP